MTPTDKEKRAALHGIMSARMDEMLAEQAKNDNDPSYVRGRMAQAKSTLWQLEHLGDPVEGLTYDSILGVLRNIVKWDEEKLRKMNDASTE